MKGLARSDRKPACASRPALQPALRIASTQLRETARRRHGIGLAPPCARVISLMATARWDDHIAPRPRADGAARLLGRPTPLVGRVQELATLAAIVEQSIRMRTAR